MVNLEKNTSKKGFALVTILITFAILSVLGTIVLSMSVSQAAQTKHSVDYDKAYYLASSAVDIVAKDIMDNKIHQLKHKIEQIRTAIDLGNDPTSLIVEYNNQNDFFNNNISLSPMNINLSGTSGFAAPTVQIYKQGSYIYLQSSSTVGNSSAYAKVKLAEINTGSYSYNTPTTDALYTWNTMSIGTGNGHISSQIGYSGSTPPSIGGNTTIDGGVVHEPTPHEVHETSPHETWSAWNDAAPPAALTLLPTATRETDHVSPYFNKWVRSFSSSGYYGSKTDSINNIIWDVDTSGSPDGVTLVFDNLTFTGQATINVHGGNKLLIYLINPVYSATPSAGNYLLNANVTDFSIIGEDAAGNPLTYIISYDPRMQDPSHGGSAIDQLYIKNASNLQAFIYMPFTNVYIKNNLAMTGSIAANGITIENSIDLAFKVSPWADFGGNNVGTTLSFNYQDFTINKTWIK